MDIIEHIKRRRSIRHYTEQEVTDGQVHLLLEAAMAAPSAHNSQPWAFVVVRDRELKRELALIHQFADMADDASVVFVVVGDPALSDHWVEDCSAATENLLLAADGIGLGAVWVGVHPGEEREDAVGSILGIPPDQRILCLVPVGYPAEAKPARTQYTAEKVHSDTW